MGQPMERQFLFGAAKNLKEAFPEIESALIEHYETGDGTYDYNLKAVPSTYTVPRQVREPLMRCSNPRCERGGYEIDREIRNMTLSKSCSSEFILDCHGDEGSPKGRKKGNPCMNRLHVRLTLKYKP
jgi:hypothetical protein